MFLAFTNREPRISVGGALVLAALLTPFDAAAQSAVQCKPAGALMRVAALYGTLVLAERRSGYVIMLLVGLFAAAMPVIHMRGAHYSEIARSTGGFFFVWTLWALGGLGGLTFILSARGLWNLRRGQSRKSNNANMETPHPA